MIYHLVGLLAGFLLDAILGDPYCMPHPVRLIGQLISRAENKLLKEDMSDKIKRRNGRILVIWICLLTVSATLIIMGAAYCINGVAGCLVEAILSYYALAAKSLKTESMKVYRALADGTLDDGRKAVSMIVGRDTKELSRDGVIRAAVETVAENTSDGVIAPMIYLAIGGPVLGFLYKAINTMDSMVGYKNDKYLYFGRCAAHIDDVVNFIPARISAYIMIVSTLFMGKITSLKGAARIFKRDRFNHASPNSAQTESVIAGALGIRLAGPASYFGKIVEKPYIGDALREIELDDIKRANRMMYITSVICLVICEGILCTVGIFTGIL